MNLALIIFRADPDHGGAERYTAGIAAALAERGHRIDLIATRFGPPIPSVNFVPLAVKGATRAAAYGAFLYQLDESLARKKYDLVHAMLPVRRCDLYHPHAGLAKAALRSHLARSSPAGRTLAQIGNRFNRKRQLNARTEDAMLHAPVKPLVLCLSDYVKGLVLEHYPDISDQLVKLFNGIDLHAFDPSKHSAARQSIRQRFGVSPSASVALMIAQRFYRKGLSEVIEATANLSRQSTGAPTVLVVGKDDPAQGRRLARQLDIEQKIVFCGPTSQAADFYAAADFFVLPTRHDSCSLAVLEALAMGVPVISTIFNGACDIMTNGHHGFVLPDPADVPALTAAMQRLLDPNSRHTMSRACLALRPELSFDAHLNRLEEIYTMRRSRH
jgi:UDP-glucose:(heptosyl)LPS alpha-1,3-glucosyltransferase